MNHLSPTGPILANGQGEKKGQRLDSNLLAHVIRRCASERISRHNTIFYMLCIAGFPGFPFNKL
jgi:hypothetical protein